jgi:hypothetical protein
MIIDPTTFNVFELVVFGFLASIKDITLSFLRVQFSLFQRIAMLANPFSPFLGGQNMNNNFPILDILFDSWILLVHRLKLKEFSIWLVSS